MKHDLHRNIRHGVSNPNDVYSVVGLELKFHMKWTRWNIECPLAKLSNIFQAHHLELNCTGTSSSTTSPPASSWSPPGSFSSSRPHLIPQGLLQDNNWLVYCLLLIFLGIMYEYVFLKAPFSKYDSQNGSSGDRVPVAHQHLFWGCQRHSKHQRRT